MSYLLKMPMKFECTYCNHCYVHHYQYEDHHYPTCPDCQKAGLLMGVAEMGDVLHHPMIFASSYLKETWHMLSKRHS